MSDEIAAGVFVGLVAFGCFIFILMWSKDQIDSARGEARRRLIEEGEAKAEKVYLCSNCLSINKTKHCPTNICKPVSDKEFKKRHGKSKDNFIEDLMMRNDYA